MNADCEGIRPLLSEHMDGRLEEPQRAAVEAHLQTCPECADELASLRETVALLRQLPEVEVPRSFAVPEGAPARAAAPAASPPVDIREHRQRRWPWSFNRANLGQLRMIGAAAAAVFVIVIAAVLYTAPTYRQAEKAALPASSGTASQFWDTEPQPEAEPLRAAAPAPAAAPTAPSGGVPSAPGQAPPPPAPRAPTPPPAGVVPPQSTQAVPPAPAPDAPAQPSPAGPPPPAPAIQPAPAATQQPADSTDQPGEQAQATSTAAPLVAKAAPTAGTRRQEGEDATSGASAVAEDEQPAQVGGLPEAEPPPVVGAAPEVGRPPDLGVPPAGGAPATTAASRDEQARVPAWLYPAGAGAFVLLLVAALVALYRVRKHSPN